MIRLFAALPAPVEIAEGLARRQEGLPGARWSIPEHLHITLAFFGEITEVVAADLDEALGTIDLPAFDVTLQGVGATGEGHDIRSVWAGLAENPALSRLAGRCEAAGRRLGLKMEARTYRPHMTLAYLRRSPPPRVAAWVQEHNMLQSPAWRADQFALYSSWKGPDGSQYDLERVYRLGGP